MRVGDRIRFCRPLTAGPEPHAVTEGVVRSLAGGMIAVKLPGQRALFRGFAGEIEVCP